MSSNHVLLQRFELSSASAAVTFRNLPQSGYKDLKVVASTRGTSSNILNLSMQINEDSTSSYSYYELTANGSTASSGSGTGTYLNSIMPGSSITANTFSNNEIYFFDYLSSLPKSISVDAVTENNTTSTDVQIRIQAWGWSGTVPIKSINFYNAQGSNFAAGTSFSIYGIAEVNAVPQSAPKAFGGDIITNDGEYWYHAFLTTGAFKPKTNLTCDYLVLAGGGSGGVGAAGGGGAGGGGAGGFRTSISTTGGGGAPESPILVYSETYPVTVGAGGPAVYLADYIVGNQGNNSTFATITSTGGGYGSGASNGGVHPGGSGGSGGGASEWNRTSGTTSGGSAATPTQGYRGGNCAPTSPDRHGAGGGGASQAGGDTVNGANGKGGDGFNIAYLANYLTGIPSVVGGGGGGSSESNVGAGGAGGGGAGLNSTPSPGTATSGTAYTGGGGGGAGGNSGTLKTSGAGGSGMVIIRYAMA